MLLPATTWKGILRYILHSTRSFWHTLTSINVHIKMYVLLVCEVQQILDYTYTVHYLYRERTRGRCYALDVYNNYPYVPRTRGTFPCIVGIYYLHGDNSQ